MATGPKPTVVITGIAGNLGQRLLPLLSNFRVVGVDFRLSGDGALTLAHFTQMDLGKEQSCHQLVELFREYNVSAVVHLAFIIDAVQTGVLDSQRMWQINVAGTARVMEAIAEVNRNGGNITHFVFPSSVSAYGPELPPLVKEDYPLGGHTLPYAIHKKECDEVVQKRASILGDCATFLLRPHIFTGRSMHNYIVGALRGTPTGKGRIAAWLRERNKRLPMLLPFGEQYPAKQLQFVHVDDMARLIQHVLEDKPAESGLHTYNVAGRGEPVTIAQASQVANAKTSHLPGLLGCKLALKALWKLGVCAAPPEALPYMVGSYTMDTSKLQHYLGGKYKQVIRYTVEEALADTFEPAKAVADPMESKEFAAGS
jgi:nucleoside-diphosphate-sugar epimerase